MGQDHQQSLPHHCHNLDHFGQGMPLHQYQLVCPKSLCHQLHLQQKPQQVNQDTVEHRYISHFSILESLKHGSTNLRYNSQQFLPSYCNHIEPKPNYELHLDHRQLVNNLMHKKLPRTKQLTFHSMQQYQKTQRFFTIVVVKITHCTLAFHIFAQHTWQSHVIKRQQATCYKCYMQAA